MEKLVVYSSSCTVTSVPSVISVNSNGNMSSPLAFTVDLRIPDPVSYTHLTLPTIYSV